MNTRLPKVEMPGELTSVTAAEIIRNFGHWQHKALEAPLAVTHHGRSRVMLISVERYEQLVAAKPKASAQDPIELVQFIDNAAEGFLAHDAHLRVTYVNKVAENYFGRHRAQLIGQAMDGPDWNPGDDYIRSMWRQVLETGASVSYETESRLFKGRRISVRTFPYKDGIATLFLNITERERLRASAETSKALDMAIAQSGRVATALLDVRGRLSAADAVFSQLLGFTAADLQAVRLTNCIVPKDRRRAEQFFEGVWTQMKSGLLTLGIIVKSGEERRFKMAVIPLLRDYVQTGVMLMLAEDHDAPA